MAARKLTLKEALERLEESDSEPEEEESDDGVELVGDFWVEHFTSKLFS